MGNYSSRKAKKPDACTVLLKKYESARSECKRLAKKQRSARRPARRSSRRVRSAFGPLHGPGYNMQGPFPHVDDYRGRSASFGKHKNQKFGKKTRYGQSSRYGTKGYGAKGTGYHTNLARMMSLPCMKSANCHVPNA